MGIGNNFIGDVEELLVKDVIKSKNLFRFSKEEHLSYTFIFENQIKEMYNVSGVIMFPSATLALTSFMKTLKLNKEDEVIITPLSWVADYSALLFEGIKIRFCEINENMQVSLDSIKDLINEKTRVIVIPHLMGRGQQEIDKISELCKEKKIILIEDIAQGFGIKVKGKYAGSYGDFAFSSLNHHKLMSTGDGGFGLFRDKEKYEEVSRIHDQGCLIDEFGKRNTSPENYTKGFSLRVNNLTGAIALSQLARFSLLKAIVLEKYNQLISLLSDEEKTHLIKANKGDIPYTALFKSDKNKNYPSLLKSGWHFIENIPYYNKIETDKNDKHNIEKSKNSLESIYAIGTGFIDKYYAIPEGTEIDKDIKEQDIKKTIREIL